jgi:hypothetical protein
MRHDADISSEKENTVKPLRSRSSFDKSGAPTMIHRKGAEVAAALMSTERQSPLRNVMIPWVITLIALLGWNAFAPEHGRMRKGDSQGGIGLTQITDDPEIANRVANPEIVAPTGADAPWVEPGPLWNLVLILKAPSLRIESIRAGEAHGRAPPALGAALMA